MITGIGTDIVDIRRIERLVERFGDRFLNKVYTPSEREKGEAMRDLQRRNAYYAKRFAAKEACLKAMNDKSLSWQDMEIRNEASGKPILMVRGEQCGQLSLSDEPPYAIAFVVLT